jgi:hypothetical protein
MNSGMKEEKAQDAAHAKTSNVIRNRPTWRDLSVRERTRKPRFGIFEIDLLMPTMI